MFEPVSECVNRYLTDEAPDTNMLPPEQALALALKAVRKYMAYGELTIHRAQRLDWQKRLKAHEDVPDRPDLMPVDGELLIEASEWGVICDLWWLYMERDQAKQLEATRGLGADVFGRSTSEIEGDIRVEHENLPLRAFYFGVVTV